MKIVMVAGSNRSGASSTALLHYMAKEAKSRGVRAVVFDLFEKPLPIYSPDRGKEDPNVALLMREVLESDAIVLATPEYHGSISGALKNALDYISSHEVAGKAVLSVSSAGGAVGVSSLTHLQAIVRNLHGINCPEWLSLGGAAREFAADGTPADAGIRQRVAHGLDTLMDLTARLRPQAAEAGSGSLQS